MLCRRFAASTASSRCVGLVGWRWHSTTPDDVKEPHELPSALRHGKNQDVRSTVFPPSEGKAPRGAARNVKEERLVQMWREQPNDAPAGADGSTTGPSVAEVYGQTFRDSRPVDPNESAECKRRRLIYQSKYRGMVEMDLIFGHFARCKLETIDAERLGEYDVLLKQYDNDLFHWLVMGIAPPEDINKMPCFHLVKSFVDSEREQLLGHY